MRLFAGYMCLSLSLPSPDFSLLYVGAGSLHTHMAIAYLPLMHVIPIRTCIHSLLSEYVRRFSPPQRFGTPPPSGLTL
ncbi:hypothetical protein F5X96DRAFT_621627 [Biscogniauxia mediterranea]|nr:hypothetical protein F5X96DRAFT_621627 [Biscogniauxia mediterranea]